MTWENLCALGIAAAVVGLLIVFKPDATVLTLAGSVVGGCLTFIQRRQVP